MTWCDTGKLTIRPNVKATTKDVFRGPASQKGEVGPVMSKEEKEEIEFLDSLLNDKGEDDE